MAVYLQNQAKASERQANKRQEAGSQPSERQGRQPAEKNLIRGKRQGKAKRPSQAEARQKQIICFWPLSLFVACKQPAASQASNKQARQAASKPAGSKAEAEASQPAGKQASQRTHIHTSCVVYWGARAVSARLGSFLTASQTWTDLPDGTKFLTARKSWTEFGEWILDSICRKSRSWTYTKCVHHPRSQQEQLLVTLSGTKV